MSLKPVPEIQEWLESRGITHQSYFVENWNDNPEINHLEDEIADLDDGEKLRKQFDELYENSTRVGRTVNNQNLRSREDVRHRPTR